DATVCSSGGAPSSGTSRTKSTSLSPGDMRRESRQVLVRTSGRGRKRYVQAMVGVVIMIVAMVLIVPVAIMFGGAIWSALFGWISSDDADRPATAPEEPAS